MSCDNDDDDGAVLESALAFLDEFYAPPDASAASADAPPGSDTSAGSDDSLNTAEKPRTPARESKKRDTNRARAKARRDLLALRTSVSVLESELAALSSRRQQGGEAPRAVAGAASPAALVWKEIAASQLDQCVRSKCENKRLRALVADKKKVLVELRRHLISRVIGEATKEFCVSQTEMRLPAFNMRVIQVMQELSSRADATYLQVDSLFYALGCQPTMETRGADTVSVSNGARKSLAARHSLPFDASSTGIATWHHLSSIIRPFAMSLFSYRDENDEAMSTVTEYFGMKLTHGATSAEFSVTQTMRRYFKPGQQVIVYESVMNPTAFNGESVRVGSFREQGAVRITPQRQRDASATPMTTVDVFYGVTPPSTAEYSAADAVATFVLESMLSVTSTNFFKIENILIDGEMLRSKEAASE